MVIGDHCDVIRFRETAVSNYIHVYNYIYIYMYTQCVIGYEMRILNVVF